MRLLLVTYSFPPAAGVGVLRAFSLAKYLPANGVRVDVLCARNAAAVGQDAGLLGQLSPEVAVHRTWTPDLPFALRKAIKKAVTGRGSAGSGTIIATAKATADPTLRDDNKEQAVITAVPTTTRTALGWKGMLRRLLGNLLLPDPQVGWVPFALRVARRIAPQMDAVLVTVPPFSSVRVVSGLRRRYPHLPIVLDFRDEWLTTTLHLVSFNSNARARTVAETAEREAVHAATLVVCVTEAAVRELRGRYPELPAERFTSIPNGFDTAVAEPVRPHVAPGAPVVLTYIGTVYGSTDPTPVVEAILALPAELRARLRLRFIGHIETEHFRQVLGRLGPQVELVGFLPQARALEYIRSTTYLLLVTHDPINVAAKLYDYLASGVPVVAAVHPSGDVRRILVETGAGRVADIGSPEAIGRMLREAIADADAGTSSHASNTAAIAGYHRSVLTARYADVLRGLVAGAGQVVDSGRLTAGQETRR